MTYKEFFRLLRKVRRRGYEFQFIATPLVLKRKGRRVNAHMVAHVASNSGIWSPIDMVCDEFYKDNNLVLYHPFSAERLGLPAHKANELRKAISERKGHSPALRRRLLAAVGLLEIPDRKRSPVKESKKEHKGKRQ